MRLSDPRQPTSTFLLTITECRSATHFDFPHYPVGRNTRSLTLLRSGEPATGVNCLPPAGWSQADQARVHTVRQSPSRHGTSRSSARCSSRQAPALSGGGLRRHSARRRSHRSVICESRRARDSDHLNHPAPRESPGRPGTRLLQALQAEARAAGRTLIHVENWPVSRSTVRRRCCSWWCSAPGRWSSR